MRSATTSSHQPFGLARSVLPSARARLQSPCRAARTSPFGRSDERTIDRRLAGQRPMERLVNHWRFLDRMAPALPPRRGNRRTTESLHQRAKTLPQRVDFSLKAVPKPHTAHAPPAHREAESLQFPAWDSRLEVPKRRVARLDFPPKRPPEMAGTVPFDESDEQTEARSTADAAADAEQVARDLLDHLTQYAQEHPGRAALFCLGLGFYLGWKLKP